MEKEAGISNLISGRAFKGLKELAKTEWTVDTDRYVQCEHTGNWYLRESESCPCSHDCDAGGIWCFASLAARPERDTPKLIMVNDEAVTREILESLTRIKNYIGRESNCVSGLFEFDVTSAERSWIEREIYFYLADIYQKNHKG